MAWLSSHPRCSVCGSLLDLDSPQQCPTCRASIAESGQQTDFDLWRVTRERGKFRYVWVGSVLMIGVPMALLFTGVKWSLRGTFPGPEDLILSGCWIALAYVIAALRWSGCEQEFLQEEAHRAANSSAPEAPPSVPDDPLSAPR